MPLQSAQQTAAHLLDIGAVQFRPEQPFQWASGMLAPIYCDSRLTLSFPEIRHSITDSFLQLIKEYFGEAQGIAGVATAGIPQAALLAERLSLPLCYVRASPKGHGLTNLIEGKIDPQQKVVVIEDVLSTGQSSIKAVQALREAGLEVLGIVAIFTYGFDLMEQNFQEANIPYYTLTDYTTLLSVYAKKFDLSESIMATLHEWRKNPQQWQSTVS
ncbi:MAG TPA: orotate phosphoribosyltransferase [Microscillaceae bacterium]|nr:orotate phosphoribosyltransferase [Microscillaceae bacterium]